MQAMLRDTGMSEDWVNFFLLVAARESNFNPTAENTSPSEAEAARKSYEHNEAKLAPCGHPAVTYTWGSGGWYGFLPAVAMLHLPPGEQCLPPGIVPFNPELSTAAAAGNARGLMNWAGYQSAPSFATLRQGWGNPSAMGHAAHLQERIPKWIGDGKKVWPGASDAQVLDFLSRVPVRSDLPTPRTVLDRLGWTAMT